MEYDGADEPEDLARQLFARAVDLDENWVTLSLRTARHIEGELVLTYTCFIPFDSTLCKGAKWIDFNDMTEDNSVHFNETVYAIKHQG